ncbi:MAG: selenocysteine-specific translation elongation factor, partial [Dehalococcoidales bacterium]|nr:selenocysteine-specific translation elongation factor [Dehalococcoidales bacterium]
MFVMSTAGHIDHGKSVLVQALTGIDPDRLREEKERGMTIDLGFAWLKLPHGQEVGVVDVPGHERFIGNMLAGVGGVDLVLLVVAANEGVMPQTKEHLAILDLLEIKKGVVAVTKKDLVDDEWLTLVKMEVEEVLKPTTLAGSPIIPVSVVKNEGVAELLSVIEKQLADTQPRKDLGRPRLPIDRVFTITGSGTIITGTLIDGSFSVGQDVEIVPKRLKSRIRGLQVHKTKSDSAQPGTRVAANLVGVSVEQLQRGDVLTKPGWLVPTELVTGKLRLLDYLPRSLRHSTEVTFFTGAAQILAKVRLLEGDVLKPGENAWAQFVLEKPVAIVNGDHYIIRSTTDTLGGGKIIEAHAKRLRRRQSGILQGLKTKEEGTLDEIILALLTAKQPAEGNDLLSRSQLPAGDVNAVIDELIDSGRVVTIGQGEHRLLVTAPGWDNIVRSAAGFLQEYHKKFPLRPGMPREELRNKLKMGTVGSSVLQKLAESGAVMEEGTDIRLPSFYIQLNATQQSKINAFLDSLAKNPYQ